MTHASHFIRLAEKGKDVGPAVEFLSATVTNKNPTSATRAFWFFDDGSLVISDDGPPATMMEYGPVAIDWEDQS